MKEKKKNKDSRTAKNCNLYTRNMPSNHKTYKTPTLFIREQAKMSLYKTILMGYAISNGNIYPSSVIRKHLVLTV